MNNVFQFLESKGIVDGSSAFEVVRKLNLTQAVDLLEGCFLATNKQDVNNLEWSLLSFSANTSLAGGIEPCSSIGCRIEQAYRLALFGGLYSDKLYLPNLFDYYYDMIQRGRFPNWNKNQINYFYNRLIGDIAVYFQFKPLIDAGIATINKTVFMTCSHCHRIKRMSERIYRKKIDTIANGLESKVATVVKFELTDPGFIHIIDPENYVSGESGISIEGSKFEEHVNKFAIKIPHKFTTEEVKKLGLVRRVMNQPIRDLLEQNYYENLKSATYLTNRQFDLDIIEKSNEQERRLSPIKPNDFYHSLPFLEDILIEDLLRLRLQNGESFDVYRDALNQAVREAPGSIQTQELIKDLINPAIHKIENIIRQNKDHFRGRASKKIKYNAFIISLGFMATSIFSADPTKAPLITGIAGASALAGAAFKMLPEIVRDWVQSDTIPVEAANNPFYFLWKVKGNN